MSDPIKPTFLVDAYVDPVLVRIEGRASFLNSGGLKDFFTEMTRQGKGRPDRSRFASVREQWTAPFLGVLAGAALELRKRAPAGTLTLVRVGERNLELIRNLGLHRLATVDAGNFPMNLGGGSTSR